MNVNTWNGIVPMHTGSLGDSSSRHISNEDRDSKGLFLGKAILICIFLRWWIYWEALFCVPIGLYLVHLSDIVSLVGGMFLVHRYGIENRNLYAFAKWLWLLLMLHGVMSLIKEEDFEFLDMLMSSGYIVLPYFVFSVLPNQLRPFVSKLIVLTLIWFVIQQVVFPLTGYLMMGSAVDDRIFVFGEVAGMERVNNTLGGPTAGSHTAVMLLISLAVLSPPRAILKWILVLLSALAVAMAMSRSSIVVLGAFFVGWLPHMKGVMKSPFIRLVGILLVLAAMSWTGVSRVIYERSMNRTYNVYMSDEKRMDQIALGVSILGQDLNWLVGSGFGSMYLRSWIPVNTLPLVPSVWSSKKDNDMYRMNSSHNTYLVLLTETGIVVFAILVGMYVKFILLPIMRFRTPAVVGILCVLALTLNTETIILRPAAGFAFAMIAWAGLGCSLDGPSPKNLTEKHFQS